jgi:hypothetical protein
MENSMLKSNTDWKPEYCQKGVEDCYCKVGFPYEKMCPDCRDNRQPQDIYSRCVCPPDEKVS